MISEKRKSELLWSCDSYEQMCERVVALEELVRELYLPSHEMCGNGKLTCDRCLYFGDGIPCDLTKLHDRMKELSVPMEVES